MPPGPIVVYGSNGATGALIVRLATEAGREVIVAGRCADALRAVACGQEVRVGTLDAGELDRICAGAAAVISCVAPYSLHGRPLVEAAIRAGAHYVDCTGEPRYVAGLIADFDAPARRAAVVLVPAAGIGLCTNVVARAAIETLQDVRSLTVDYRVRGMIPSPGTTASTRRLLASGAAVARGGALSFTPPGEVRPLAGGDRGAGFPLTDVVTLQRQWPEAEITGHLRLPAAALIGTTLRVASGLARRPGFQRAVDRAAGRLSGLRLRPRGRFDVTVTADGTGGAITAVGRVADIYEMTSRAALYVTEVLITGDIEPGFRSTGQVVGPPAAVAEAVGIRLELDPYANGVGA